jgi:glyoxylase-like metal-dependent hydrolase (beta-lactamase superfamily II)/rhodanese-related sulfurtransferase
LTVGLTAVRTPGLGDTTYVLTHEGVTIVVDPQRDIDRFEEAIGDGDLRLVLETHLHNDYLSGGRKLAAEHGAELVMPAGAAPVYRHRPAFHMEDIDLGAMVVRPLHTPGHTPEHTSYLVSIDGREVAVFSGGSLLAGSAGRTDLLGRERAETLARLQYGSVRRLAALPGGTRLCPTHGAGSFCTAGAAGRFQSTIGEERSINPVLAHPDEDSFVAAQLLDLPPYPTYYRHMAPINLSGPTALATLEVPEMSPTEVAALGDEVVVVDARPVDRYAAGHIPGSLSIELRSDFGVWVGWCVEFGAPLVLVIDPDQDVTEAVRQLRRIGYDEIRGVLRGLEGWDGPLGAYRVADTLAFAEAALLGEQIVDTRAPSEWDSGNISGSTLLYVPDVVENADRVLDRSRPVWVACASGFRAGIAASLLATRGFEPVLLARAGVTEVLQKLSHDQPTHRRMEP